MKKGITTLLTLLLLTHTLFSANVITWVPSYFIDECKTTLKMDMGGVGMEDAITHLAMQFWAPNPTTGSIYYISNGGTKATDSDVIWFRDNVRSDVKKMLCVYNNNGGWDWNMVKPIIDNATLRTNFVASLVSEMNRLGLDGIEIDLEGPAKPEHDPANDKTNFLLFVQQLIDSTDKYNKEVTLASYSHIWNGPNSTWWNELLAMGVTGITSMGYENMGITGDYSYHNYSTQKTKVNDPNGLMLGMPTYTGSSWRGNTVLEQVSWAVDNGVGVGIWDASLGDGSGSANNYWRTAAVWNKLAQIKGSQVVLPTYSITATAASGGSISPSGSVSVDSSKDKSFTIAANSGYGIDSIVVDGVNKGALSIYTFSQVNSNHTINAYFSQVPSYTISASTMGNGSVSPSGNVSVDSSSSKTFIFTANSGYQLDTILVDGAPVTFSNNSYTFTNISKGYTIVGIFGESQCSYPEWSSSTVYLGEAGGSNDTISYDGYYYKADFWTQGDQPDLNHGNSLPWTQLGECTNGANKDTTVTETVLFDTTMYDTTITVNETIKQNKDTLVQTIKVETVTDSQQVRVDSLEDNVVFNSFVDIRVSKTENEFYNQTVTHKYVPDTTVTETIVFDTTMYDTTITVNETIKQNKDTLVQTIKVETVTDSQQVRVDSLEDNVVFNSFIDIRVTKTENEFYNQTVTHKYVPDTTVTETIVFDTTMYDTTITVNETIQQNKDTLVQTIKVETVTDSQQVRVDSLEDNVVFNSFVDIRVSKTENEFYNQTVTLKYVPDTTVTETIVFDTTMYDTTITVNETIKQNKDTLVQTIKVETVTDSQQVRVDSLEDNVVFNSFIDIRVTKTENEFYNQTVTHKYVPDTTVTETIVFDTTMYDTTITVSETIKQNKDTLVQTIKVETVTDSQEVRVDSLEDNVVFNSFVDIRVTKTENEFYNQTDTLKFNADTTVTETVIFDTTMYDTTITVNETIQQNKDTLVQTIKMETVTDSQQVRVDSLEDNVVFNSFVDIRVTKTENEFYNQTDTLKFNADTTVTETVIFDTTMYDTTITVNESIQQNKDTLVQTIKVETVTDSQQVRVDSLENSVVFNSFVDIRVSKTENEFYNQTDTLKFKADTTVKETIVFDTTMYDTTMVIDTTVEDKDSIISAITYEYLVDSTIKRIDSLEDAVIFNSILDTSVFYDTTILAEEVDTIKQGTAIEIEGAKLPGNSVQILNMPYALYGDEPLRIYNNSGYTEGTLTLYLYDVTGNELYREEIPVDDALLIQVQNVGRALRSSGSYLVLLQFNKPNGDQAGIIKVLAVKK